MSSCSSHRSFSQKIEARRLKEENRAHQRWVRKRRWQQHYRWVKNHSFGIAVAFTALAVLFGLAMAFRSHFM